MNNFKKKTSYLYLLYLFLLGGYVLSRGNYSFASVVSLIIFLGLIINYLFFRRTIISLNNLPSLLFLQKIILIVSIFLSIILYGGYSQSRGLMFNLSLYLLAALLFLTVFLKANRFIWFFWIVYTILGLFMLLSSPQPVVDVFIILKEGAEGLLRGKNPYSMVFTHIKNYPFYPKGIDNYYCYFPLTIVLTIPSIIISNDPRVSLLLAQLVVSFFLYKKLSQPYLSLIFLFNPLSLLILEMSWIEPLVILLLFLFLYFISKKKFFISSVFLGFLLATKQYTILLIPLLWELLAKKKQKASYLLTVLVIVGIITVPFILWSFKDFFHDTVSFLFYDPFRSDGLTFTAFVYNNFSILLPFWIFPLIWLISFLFIYIRKREVSSFGAMLRSILFVFIFFFFNKRAFANYYYFISSFLLFLIGLKSYEEKGGVKPLQE